MKSLPFVSALLTMLLAAPPSAVASPSTEPHGTWPLRPRPEVVRGFDPPDVVWGGGHRGVDLAGSVGQAVHAALAGRVSFVGRVAGVSVVVVDHGSTRTTYQPVAARVEVGAEVPAGSVIGTLQWFGTHCLPAACLHWGLLAGDRYLDPLMLVDGPSPVRLLPLDGSTPALPSGSTAPRQPSAAPTRLALPLLTLTPWA